MTLASICQAYLLVLSARCGAYRKTVGGMFGPDTSYPRGTPVSQLRQRLPAQGLMLRWLETFCIKFIAATELLILQIKISRLRRHVPAVIASICVAKGMVTFDVSLQVSICTASSTCTIALAVTVVYVCQVDLIWLRVQDGDYCTGETKASHVCMLHQKIKYSSLAPGPDGDGFTASTARNLPAIW
ncbi:hypothetical protein BDR06DRAFT_996072 [Suillus hirtellus]|nr:hypothetical protein BDR06DRAFT_996072 [Suillus hirtellus]